MLRKPGSCGRAAPGVELAVLDDDGRPVATGASRASSTCAATPASSTSTTRTPRPRGRRTRGDWLSVGDVAYLDDDGFVYICDRKRDMIISGGVNIYPAEIEDALHRHPKIEDAAVFGVPDDEWGERVHAAVEPRRGETLTADEVAGLLPRSTSPTTRFRARCPSTPRSPATPRASSSSACCASRTGPAAPPACSTR